MCHGSTAQLKRFKHTPFQTTESKCFAENWICATVPQEISHNSKSIYSTHKIIISLERGEDGFCSDIKLHTENCLYQKQLYKSTPKPPENVRKLKDIAPIEFLEFFWTKYILFCENLFNSIQDIRQNAKIAFNFLIDFSNVQSEKRYEK